MYGETSECYTPSETFYSPKTSIIVWWRICFIPNFNKQTVRSGFPKLLKWDAKGTVSRTFIALPYLRRIPPASLQFQSMVHLLFAAPLQSHQQTKVNGETRSSKKCTIEIIKTPSEKYGLGDFADRQIVVHISRHSPEETRAILWATERHKRHT